MIARIRGTVLESGSLLVVLDVNGIGYEVHIPVTTAEKIAGIGEECNLYTLSVYREDSTTLYGFATRDERDFFRLIVERVPGIGPKIAISILSRLSLETLHQAIADSDVALLYKCPGIGKKNAERLIVELKDKVGPPHSKNLSADDPSGAAASATVRDAIVSLVTLGYKPGNAEKLVRTAQSELGADTSTEALIKQALSRNL